MNAINKKYRIRNNKSETISYSFPSGRSGGANLFLLWKANRRQHKCPVRVMREQ